MEKIKSIAFVTDTKDINLLADVSDFCAFEGESLRDLLEDFGEFEAADAVLDLAVMHGESGLDLDYTARVLVEVLESLQNIPFIVVEHAARAGVGPNDLHAAICWYGARISEFADRFER